jgi:hypothetical protein
MAKRGGRDGKGEASAAPMGSQRWRIRRRSHSATTNTVQPEGRSVDRRLSMPRVVAARMHRATTMRIMGAGRGERMMMMTLGDGGDVAVDGDDEGDGKVMIMANDDDDDDDGDDGVNEATVTKPCVLTRGCCTNLCPRSTAYQSSPAATSAASQRGSRRENHGWRRRGWLSASIDWWLGAIGDDDLVGIE